MSNPHPYRYTSESSKAWRLAKRRAIILKRHRHTQQNIVILSERSEPKDLRQQLFICVGAAVTTIANLTFDTSHKILSGVGGHNRYGR